MTQKTINSINLYKGENPSTIEKLLKLQSSSVVNELKEHFGVTGISDLANKLSNYEDNN